MSRFKQLCNEILELRSERNHRSSLYIHNILENNRALFLKELDEDTYRFALKNFGALADASASNYFSSAYADEYARAFEALAFHLNRII